MGLLSLFSRAARRPQPPLLTPARNVTGGDGGRFDALSDDPWLILSGGALPGDWVELVYETGLLEPAIRPVLRFVCSDGPRDFILPAAYLGRTIWIGRIPETALEMEISPTNRVGPFAFRVARFRRLSPIKIFWRALRWEPRFTFVALAAKQIGYRFVAGIQLRRALAGTRPDRYVAWSAPRQRQLELDSFDARLCLQHQTPRLCLLASDVAGERALQLALAEHSWPSGQVFQMPDGPLRAILADFSDDDLVVVMCRGARPGPLALPVLAAAAAEEAGDLFYGDDAPDASGRCPKLRFAWDPVFARSRRLPGESVAFRIGYIRQNGFDASCDLLLSLVTNPPPDLRGRHIARPLFTLGAVNPPSCDRNATWPSVKPSLGPCASLIIPTRDRLELLKPCLDSLLLLTGRSDFEVIVLDNGSKDPATLDYLAKIRMNPRCRVLAQPGPFNFSALCNAGAKAARAPILVFLNNDVEVIAADWLDRMLALATLPEIGAVGAKLLYPDLTIQHAGVVIGIDGRAGHFERRLSRDAEGFFSRLNAPHEISAVTAACLAVASDKFQAVDGFDAVNLPIELNDVDFCLRLSERGWSNVMQPEAVLLHRESASRGESPTADTRYSASYAYFCERWRKQLRNDRHFHPALSLERLDAALG